MDDHQTSNCRIRVDLTALRENYASIRKISSAEVGAVVKANGYGLGANAVSAALVSEGCERFFTATTSEAVNLRRWHAEITIYVLSPVLPDDIRAIREFGLVPCVYDAASLSHWESSHHATRTRARTALHVETGINRLGLGERTLSAVAQAPERLDMLGVELVMSHLACADEPDHAMNRIQLERFTTLAALFPSAKASLCNSAGVFLGSDYHFDLLRPGICLYGHDPQYEHYVQRNAAYQPRVNPVATFETRLGQVKALTDGDAVGYGATYVASSTTSIGILLAGYADGIPRVLTGNSKAPPMVASLNGQTIPVIGRVSMDMIAVDLSAVPESQRVAGQWVEIFGHNVPIETVARLSDTIPYELLTRLGSRVPRIYE